MSGEQIFNKILLPLPDRCSLKIHNVMSRMEKKQILCLPISHHAAVRSSPFKPDALAIVFAEGSTAHVHCQSDGMLAPAACRDENPLSII